MTFEQLINNELFWFLVELALLPLGNFILNHIKRWLPTSIIVWVSLLKLCMFAALCLALYYYTDGSTLIATTSFVLLFAYCLSKTYQLCLIKSIGILKAERNLSKGTNYEMALKSCHKSMWFLGVGGYKLTKEAEFIKAVQRCDHHGETKLLLSSPDNLLIERASRKAGEEVHSEYSNKIKTSLRKIKKLKYDHGYNIKVKFYPKENFRDTQQFRLMFIDDERCLASYTVFGYGKDGSDLPQVIFNNTNTKEATRTLYYPMKKYFENLWDDPTTEEWDFEKYLDD